MTIDDEYLEHHLGSLMTTAGTDLGEQTAVAPEIVTRARRRIDVDELFTGVRAGERTHISRAITLLESTAPAHRVLAQELLVKLLPFTGNALRVGITGVPGVGKSTFIEALGMTLIGDGHKLAVLAIDPSSTKTRGSILGDKTRMAKLAREDNAFIRPSPSAGTLGGVAKATRESMVVFEAAGFDVILVETVGVGQSEVAVSQMVDCFTFLALAGAGDQLQGIKKGVMELADAIVVNKADGDNLKRALIARSDYDRMLHYIRPATEKWKTQAYTCSAVTKDGLDELWDVIQEFTEQGKENGVFLKRRQEQSLRWVRDMIDEHLHNLFFNNVVIQGRMGEVEAAVLDGEMSESQAVEELIGVFDKSLQ